MVRERWRDLPPAETRLDIDLWMWLLDTIESGEAAVLRSWAFLSAREMGQRFGVSESCIRHWESGRRRPQPELAMAYARLLQRIAQRRDEHRARVEAGDRGALGPRIFPKEPSP